MGGWVGRSSCSLIRWKETELDLRIFSHIYTLCVITYTCALLSYAYMVKYTLIFTSHIIIRVVNSILFTTLSIMLSLIKDWE